jgi:hypothetical protein
LGLFRAGASASRRGRCAVGGGTAEPGGQGARQDHGRARAAGGAPALASTCVPCGAAFREGSLSLSIPSSCLSLSLSLSFSPSLFLSISLPLSLPLCLSFSLSLFLSISFPLSLPLYLSFSLSTPLPFPRSGSAASSAARCCRSCASAGSKSRASPNSGSPRPPHVSGTPGPLPARLPRTLL